MNNARYRRLVLATMLAAACFAPPALAARPEKAHLFTSARLLLLRSTALPAHYHYHGFFVQDNVATWDGGIKPVISIDEQNGWSEGAEEAATDATKHEVLLSVQLFRTSTGARTDFGQFFTNAHPETVYVPGSEWLGGTALRGYGDRATIYRESDTASHCPGHLTSGVTFVYFNGIFSARVCFKTAGESGAEDLARRLLRRAKQART
jgi:hypothetical protein